MDEEEQKPVSTPEPQKSSKKKLLWKIVCGLLVVSLLALIAFLIWQLKNCQDSHAKLNEEKTSLQTQVDNLKKELEAEKTTVSTSPASCSAAVTQSLKDNIRDAISSKNTAALEGYMASAVNVVFAASEKGGNVTPAQAVTDLNYLNSATSPWNFALTPDVLASYKAGSYGQYFGDKTFVGKSANGYIVSFDFDDCAKIKTIFVSINDDLF